MIQKGWKCHDYGDGDGVGGGPCGGPFVSCVAFGALLLFDGMVVCCCCSPRMPLHSTHDQWPGC